MLTAAICPVERCVNLMVYGVTGHDVFKAVEIDGLTFDLIDLITWNLTHFFSRQGKQTKRKRR
jgi:hypothetical protein